jgi:hypothetical protein
MATHLPPLTLPGGYPVTITAEQWQTYIAAELQDQRGDLETRGPWRLPVRFIAPCLTLHWEHNGYCNNVVAVTLWGKRTMRNLRESGYQLEGRLSLRGKTVSGYTGGQMFQLPDGTLLETAAIHVRAAAAGIADPTQPAEATA